MSGLLSVFKQTCIPIVRIHGNINAKMTEEVSQQLEIIKPSNAKVLAVSINSPGGLGAQADIITQKLKIYSKKHNLPLLTFAESLCASAGYYILCSGDQVYADKTSLVGSIGTVSALFRFKEILEKYNIEVRKFTSSENLLSYQLDQLSGTPQQQDKVFKPITQSTFKVFADHVEATRGSKLKGNRQKIFDGSVFLGEEAQQLGLVDEVGCMIDILQQKYPNVKTKSIVTKKTRLQNFTKWIMGSS